MNADIKHVIPRKVPIRTKTMLRTAAEDHMAAIANEPAETEYRRVNLLLSSVEASHHAT